MGVRRRLFSRGGVLVDSGRNTMSASHDRSAQDTAVDRADSPFGLIVEETLEEPTIDRLRLISEAHRASG